MVQLNGAHSAPVSKPRIAQGGDSKLDSIKSQAYSPGDNNNNEMFTVLRKQHGNDGVIEIENALEMMLNSSGTA